MDIYQNGKQVCGGTIITERVVISAAECFSLSTNNVHRIALETFKVAAGKTNQALDEQESPAAQIRDIHEVGIPDR